MSRKFIPSILLALITWAGSIPSGYGEIVDKIVAVVDGRIITQSDIRKEHRINMVLGDPDGTDDVELNAIINRYLIEEEMSQYPGLDVSDDEVDEPMKLITDTHGVSVSEIRAAVIQKIQRRKYLYIRFGQFIVVSNEEIETFYNNEFVPEAKRRGVPLPELSQVAMQIRQNISDVKLSQELEDSLKDLRSRSTIEII